MSEKNILITEEPPSYPGVTIQDPAKQVNGLSVRPQNYLGLTFFALLCCCCWPGWIFAIIGFVFSVQVDNQYTNKDFLGAQRSSKLARNWSIAAIATGLAVFFIYCAFWLMCQILGSGDEDGEDGDGREGDGHDRD